MDHQLRSDIVNQYEREFLVVWKALHVIGMSSPFGELLRLEIERASDTLLQLMRTSECIDPTISLDGTGRTGPQSSGI
jgi:hypothetical protein